MVLPRGVSCAPIRIPPRRCCTDVVRPSASDRGISRIRARACAPKLPRPDGAAVGRTARDSDAGHGGGGSGGGGGGGGGRQQRDNATRPRGRPRAHSATATGACWKPDAVTRSHSPTITFPLGSPSNGDYRVCDVRIAHRFPSPSNRFRSNRLGTNADANEWKCSDWRRLSIRRIRFRY